MPRPRSSEDLVRIHIWMARNDIERIKELFGQNVGFSQAIRKIVESFLRNLDDTIISQEEPLPAPELTPEQIKEAFQV